MSYTMFVPVDEQAARSAMWSLYQTHDFSELSYPENENDNGPIVGQDHLAAAVVCQLLYPMLNGHKWLNVVNVGNYNNPGAIVEFATEADAMIFKLANGGEA